MKRIALLTLALAASAGTWAQDYPINFPVTQKVTHSTRRLNSVGLNAGFTESRVSVADNALLYNEVMDQAVIARAGQTVRPSFQFTTAWMNGYVYVDFDRDGRFDLGTLSDEGLPVGESDLKAFSNLGGKNSAGGETGDGNVLNPPAFTVPNTVPDGFYRVRYKVDWNNADPGGSTVSGQDIVKNGGAILDTRLCVSSNRRVSVNATGTHGKVVYYNGNDFKNTKVGFGEDLVVMAYPEQGYKIASLRMRHGFLSSDSLVGGVPQYANTWFDGSQFDLGMLVIPGGYVDGDIEFHATFVPLAGDETQDTEAWKLVFFDEFNLNDGSPLNSKKWQSHQKGTAVWSRYIANNKNVAFIQDGNLVCRAIPDPNRAEGSTDMLSGAVSTMGLFPFKYGKVEARLKTVKHKGNFPAFWMMPQNNAGGWPNAGEIDIFETIDSQDRAWHTIHSKWANTLGQGNNPAKGSNEWMDVENWHVYGLEWTETELRWYVDGKHMFTYAKSSDSYAIENGQWPFDKEFYIILNQSVGDGSWAAKHDPDFTYETRFDWVRVYQKKKANVLPTGIDDVKVPSAAEDTNIYDLSGRRVSNPTRGVYIRGHKKFWVR